MDISDIGKVANRKRINTDAEKLREKVSRETAKIIKLKVAQDTAYWDLKEKLQQLEANHERLQQNMVEVQMQHEAISGQYQEELRLRPDTLNKLGGTREICDVLEEYGERLRRTVSRCRSDQRALSDAYGACGAQVRRLATDGERARQLAKERDNQAHSALERHNADARRLALSAEQLGAMKTRCDLLEEIRRELAERLECSKTDVQQRSEAISSLRTELSRLQRELDSRAAEDKRVTAQHQEELRATRSQLERETTTRRDSEQHAATLQSQLDDSRRTIDELEKQYQEATAVINRLNTELQALTQAKDITEKLLSEREQQITHIESELTQTKERLASTEVERLQVTERLTEALQRCDTEAKRADELARSAQALQKVVETATEEHADYKAESTRLVEELRLTVAERERELDAKTATITKLMGDLKGEAEAKNRAESALNTLRQQYEAERQASDTARIDLNANIHRLEVTIRTKDEELTTQKTLIQEVRGEKDRLQERIRAMQSTISNIQHELTGRTPALAPEREVVVPEKNQYSYLSDGSVDSDALDALEVNRRFEALSRGERPPPIRMPRSHATKKSLNQAKKESKLQSRRFFKSKHHEAKLDKLKE